MSLREAVEEPADLEDLRFAVVMNGGVSLAVWIAGVAMELDRLAQVRGRVARAEGGVTVADPYWQLLDLTKSTARIDVITGTSAGGLNGAFLAFASVHQKPLAPLGGLWADLGGLGDLLRSPLEPDPPSLLRGDERFLVELRRAFDTLAAEPGGSWQPPERVPMLLHMTTTLLDGEARASVDDFGSRIVEVDHEGSFRFVRDRGRDDFADAEGLLGRLALAARSTASFPVAFEASYVPVGAPGPDHLHPDMQTAVDVTGSRYVIDGGVLLNKPVRPALDAVLRLPADRQVRRVLAYVNPHPTEPPQPEPARADAPPTMARILLDSLVRLPRAQSIHLEVAELEEHNRRVRDQRLMRTDVAGTLPLLPAESATQLYGAYRQARIRRAVGHVARVVTTAQPARPGTTPAWSADEVAAAFTPGPPGQPGSEPVAFPFLPPPGALDAVLARPTDEWDWGIAALERLGAMVADVFKRAMWLAPLDEHALRGRLRARRAELSQLYAVAQGHRRDDTDFWTHEARETLPAPPADSADRPALLRAWVRSAVDRWPLSDRQCQAGSRGRVAPERMRAGQLRNLGVVAEQMATILAGSAADLRRTGRLAARSDVPQAREEAQQFAHLIDALVPSDVLDVAAVHQRLLRMEVVLTTLAVDAARLEQEVALLQITGDTPSAFGAVAAVERKLAGVKLGHFGAFYKKSWRVNDWIWGRVDGATRAVQAVLSPARLRQLQLSADEALALVEGVAVGAPGDPDHADLLARFPREGCAAELAFLAEQTWPVPPSLPVCASAIATRLHLGILREELPALVAALEDDARAGAGRSTAAARFLAGYDLAVQQHPHRLPVEATFRLFREARLGEEGLADEVGTDMLASVVSTTAAVTISAIDSNRSGLGPLRALTRPLRGVVLALYALVFGATRSGTFGRTAVTAALAVGGALVALSLLTDDTPPVVTSLGAVLVLAGLGMAALRTALWQFALVLAVPVLALVVAAAVRWSALVAAVRERGTTLLVITGVVLLAMALGSVRRRPPPAALSRAGRRAPRSPRATRR